MINKNLSTILILFVLMLNFRSLTIAAPSSSDEPIIIRLATESSLMPIYVAKFIDQDSGLDSSYLKQLENVLRFDLDHNGTTQISPENSIKNALASQIEFDGAPNLNEWKNHNIFYIVKVKINQKKLSARTFVVNSNSVKALDNIELTGELKQDRRTIHQLADTIHKALFGTEGIASTRFIYTMRTRSAENNPKQWRTEIWEADYDGANKRQVTTLGSNCVTPTYVPPKPGYISGSICFVSYKTSQPKIYLASLHDGKATRLNTLAANQFMPTISRQRDKIAFISDVTGNPDLFLQSFNPEKGAIDKPRQIFTAPHAVQGSPTFNPAGDKIAFVSNKDGSAKIYTITIPAAGQSLKEIKPTLITKKNRENTAPVWSPDGTKLAYTAMTGSTRQIWIYDFSTKEEWQLTQGEGHKENPTWAPNSLHLLFNSSYADHADIYLVNLNQPNAYKLPIGQKECRYPSWEIR